MDDSDPDSYRHKPDDDGINILGTPLIGSPAFIESYLFGKGVKHRVLLKFIPEVAAAGFPREAAVAMLAGAASHKLVYLLKSIQKTHRLLYGCGRWTTLGCQPGFTALRPR